MTRLCVFCGSNPGRSPDYVEGARELGRALVERGVGLIYGGGRRGMMGAVADSVLECGGEAVGIVPNGLFAEQSIHRGLTELRIVASMHERKATMMELSDGFVALPGGLGTLEELFEAWTWAQIGIHRMPCGLLNTLGYFDHMLAFAQHMQGEGFVQSQNRALLRVEHDPDVLIRGLLADSGSVS